MTRTLKSDVDVSVCVCDAWGVWMVCMCSLFDDVTMYNMCVDLSRDFTFILFPFRFQGVLHKYFFLFPACSRSTYLFLYFLRSIYSFVKSLLEVSIKAHHSSYVNTFVYLHPHTYSHS